MAKDDRFPDFPDFGDFSPDEQSPQVQANPSEPAFLRSEELPDYDLDEMIRAIIYQNAAPEQAEPSADSEPRRVPDTEAKPEESPEEHPEEESPAEESAEAWPEESASRIWDSRGGSEEDEEELESRYLRRLAAKEAGRSRPERRSRKKPAADEAPEEEEDSIREEQTAEAAFTGKSPRRSSPFWEKVKGPFVRYAATRAARKELREQEAASWPAPEIIRETPELPPAKAARYYAGQHRTLLVRLLVAMFLCLILAWLSFGLPMAGQLRLNPGLQAAVCLVCMLSVMMAALDIVTAGIRQLCRMRLGLEALALLSCGVSAVDAVLVMFNISDALPYCALGAFSLTAALWGERLFCYASALNFSTAAKAKGCSILTAEDNKELGLSALCRCDRESEGIVRRSEEPDLSRLVYTVAAPVLAGLALVLAIVGCLGGSWLNLIHSLSAYLCAASAFSSFLCFCLPYCSAVLRLRRSGAALAGWAGCQEIGKHRRMLVTDNDMFPAGTIDLETIELISESPEMQDKVAGYTLSLLTAAGCSSLHAFDKLMERRAYPILKVEGLKYHDGGGLSGYINNENVCIGSAGFMNLNGIRPHRNLNTANGICVAFGGKFAAVIRLRYTPLKGVQQALRILTKGRTQPIFAIRDFNISPLMIENQFRIPAINFEFPSFRERCRLSGSLNKSQSAPAAILVNSGIHGAVEAAERGRKLYHACRLTTALSVLGSVIGMLLIFLIARGTGLVSMSAGRLLGYMLLWTLPTLGAAYWVYR